MTCMKGLGDIWRGKFDDHFLGALGRIFRVLKAEEFILSICFFSSENGGDQDFGEFISFEEELKECSICERWFVNEGGFWELQEISNYLKKVKKNIPSQSIPPQVLVASSP